MAVNAVIISIFNDIINYNVNKVILKVIEFINKMQKILAVKVYKKPIDFCNNWYYTLISKPVS
ncbi:hypothetical protein CLORY_28980 [Clostridium oryzae]|uniref:Uncharacterized protein n=1 Tax=Clostridium oryzae TaxID=1450648 RepID=A0A1V4IK91_9CLOT|nr:hypothetical protein CLORY_28980 [Clostridium oryzae]